MNKRWSEFELLALLVVVALSVSYFHRTDSEPRNEPTPIPTAVDWEAKAAQWREHFQNANLAIEAKDWELAERELVVARALARTFPAGDRKLAETLDDLGLVYFSQAQPLRAAKIQGQAVSSLVLAAGPSDPEVKVYIERFGWAVKQLEFTADVPRPEQPFEFVLAFDPDLPEGRYKQEMGRLRNELEELGRGSR